MKLERKLLSIIWLGKQPGTLLRKEPIVEIPLDLPFGVENGNSYGINVNVQIDQAGRVVLPKQVRDRLRLHGGDTLALELKGDTIQLRPQETRTRLQRVNGVLVVVNGTALPEGKDLVAESRRERIDQIAGGMNEAE